jgi:hypothetical protein
LSPSPGALPPRWSLTSPICAPRYNVDASALKFCSTQPRSTTSSAACRHRSMPSARSSGLLGVREIAASGSG